MKKLLLALVFSLLIFSTLAAARTSILAPAVDSDGNGILTTISAEATPGTGRIRTDIRTSLISPDTEESMRAATEAAAKEAGVNLRNYDINIDIDSQAEIIDGPSGGLALGIIIYNELNNLKAGVVQQIRSDMTVTGAIDRDGSVIRVGGVEEKVDASHQRGLTLMLIASGQSASDSLDYVVYADEISGGKLQVIEVPTLRAALQYAYTQAKSKIEGVPEFAIRPLELEAFTATSRTQHLSVIALEEIQNAQQQLNRLVERANQGEDGQIRAVIRSVNSSLRNAQNALDNGYYYTAANAAFLARIAIETTNAQGLTSEEFAALISALEAQQAQYANNTSLVTSANFDVVAAANLRYWWSAVKLEEAKQNFHRANAVSVSAVRDYYTSRAWFQASQKLMNHAKTITGGTTLNTSNAREYALDLIEEAAVIANNSLDSEVQWHFKTSRREIIEGDYTAAVFDLQFIFSIDAASKQLENKTIAEALEMIGRINIANVYSSPTTAVWAELYYAHSLHAMQENEVAPDPSSIISIVRLRALAEDFNTAKATLDMEFVNPRPAQSRGAELPDISSPPQAEVPLQEPRVTATITPSNEFNGATQVIAIALIAIGILVLAALALNRSALSNREMLEKLDDALARGKISEPTYKRLRAKYGKKLKLEKKQKSSNTHPGKNRLKRY